MLSREHWVNSGDGPVTSRGRRKTTAEGSGEPVINAPRQEVVGGRLGGPPIKPSPLLSPFNLFYLINSLTNGCTRERKRERDRELSGVNNL